MNTKNLTTFPQTEAIPAPLEIHTSVSPKAAELLLKVTEILAETPSQYRQIETGGSDCGSPCCIIGHMRRIVGVPGYGDTGSLIGLTANQFEKIFHEFFWPRHLWRKDLRGATAPEGIARIEHFLRTGE